MNNIISQVCLLCALTLFLCSAIQAQEKVSSLEYQLQRESGQNQIVLIWKTNFPANGSSYRVVAKNQMGQQTTLDQSSAPPTISQIVLPGQTIVSGTSFKVILTYAGGSGINEATNSLDVSVTPFAGPEANPTVTKSAEMVINMPTVKHYFELEDKAQTPVQPLVPTISASILKVSDDSITVRASSPQFIRVRAFAFATTNVAATTGDSPFKSDEELLFDNRPKELRIKNLSAGTNYVIAIRESGAPNARAAAQALLSLDMNGVALRTMDPIPRPSVTILSTPVNKKNKSVQLNLRSASASKINILVEEQNTLGDWNPLGSGSDIAPSDTANLPFTREVAATLSSDKKYRIKARAFSANPDLPSAESVSEVFSGKPNSLFDIVFLDMTDSDIKFIPKQVNEPVGMGVTAVLSNGTSITVPCSGGTPTAPECSFPISSVYDRLSPVAPAPAPGSTPLNLGTGMTPLLALDLPAPTGSKRSTVKFFVTVKATDDSAREQNQVFALSLSVPATPSSSSPWKKVLEFGKSLVVPGEGNKSLDSNKVKPTGFGAVLGMLLKALVF